MKQPSRHVVVVDDDPSFLRLIAAQLESFDYIPHLTSNSTQAFASINHQMPDVILLDWQLGHEDGIELISTFRRAAPDVPVILISAECTVDCAVRTIREGAFDLLPKPLDRARLLTTLQRAVDLRMLLQRVTELSETKGAQQCGLIGNSPQMRTIYQIIQNVAPTEVSVMISGESGTGKELVARALHRNSSRANGPFVALNMAALPRELVESTLFGHERGAFTGAERKHIGACEEASGGTLFLDEIGEMPGDLQPKLLRFLQEQAFRPVGASSDSKSDVRIISATNRNPLMEIKAGRLRNDLYYRLNVVPIKLPALRERHGDIALLATHSLRQFAARYGKNFERIDEDAMEKLEAYNWPGNVRQLLHVVERIVVLEDGPVVTAAMIPADLDQTAELNLRRRITDLVDSVTENMQHVQGNDLLSAFRDPQQFKEMTMADLERWAIEQALAVHQGSAGRASQQLGISEATIYRKLKSYGLSTRRWAG